MTVSGGSENIIFFSKIENYLRDEKLRVLRYLLQCVRLSPTLMGFSAMGKFMNYDV